MLRRNGGGNNNRKRRDGRTDGRVPHSDPRCYFLHTHTQAGRRGRYKSRRRSPTARGHRSVSQTCLHRGATCCEAGGGGSFPPNKPLVWGAGRRAQHWGCPQASACRGDRRAAGGSEARPLTPGRPRARPPGAGAGRREGSGDTHLRARGGGAGGGGRRRGPGGGGRAPLC